MDVFQYVIAAGGLAFLVLQLYTNGKISDVKTDIAVTNGLIREHVAGDIEKHRAIDSHLEATDGRVGRLEDKIWS